ncbi:unnamed protein product [Orchesella dallaii]|uniref:Protein kinase domain-containing protein n=1 Tax=Orchesella dallaii TaxID=48710 RepID=A0ABP1RDR5_9HEXA
MLIDGTTLIDANKKRGLFRFAFTEDGAASESTYEIVDLSGYSEVKYIRGRFLGKGGNAKCYEVTQEGSNKALACKIVRKNMRIIGKELLNEQEIPEIRIHRNVKHPNIVDFHSYFEDDRFIYILLELCENESLLQLSQKRGAITEPEVRYFLRQILEGVKYLHEEEKIIHRDLKLGNIFITSGMKLKIGDFGLATELESEDRKYVGTPNYIAPEIVERIGYDCKADIWSIGCLLYALLIGKPPFESESLKQTYKKIKAADYEIPEGTNLSLEATRLIHQCLQLDPSKRPTAREILMDDFITEYFIPDSLPEISLTSAPSRPSAADQFRLALARKCTKTLPNVPKLYTWYDSSRRSVIFGFPDGTLQAINFSTDRRVSLYPNSKTSAVEVEESGQPTRTYEFTRCVHIMKLDFEHYTSNSNQTQPKGVRRALKMLKRFLLSQANMTSLEEMVIFYMLWSTTLNKCISN